MKWVISLVLVSAVAQINGLQSLVMDPDEKYNVTIVKSGDLINFTISAETTGWVGIGFSPNGAMTDADIIIGWVDTNGNGVIKDYFATANGPPTLDDSQDVVLLSASESNGITTIYFSRPIVSTDDKDRTITQDTTRLIYAYGNSDPGSPEMSSGDYHSSTQRGVKSAYLLESGATIPELPSDTLVWSTTAEDVTVLNKSTVYWCSYHKAPSLNNKHHILKIAPNITAGNEALVHHMLLYQCSGVTDQDVLGVGASHVCGVSEMPDFVSKCSTLVGAWAIGGADIYAPSEAGFPIGGGDSDEYYMLETHYDNPQERAGIVDSSGFTITYSPTLRDNDLAVAYVGSVAGLFIPPGAERFTVYGYCDSSCTKDFIPESGINIVSYGLHSHTAGVGIQVEVKRSGSDERTVLFSDMSYDFNFQQYKSVSPAVKLYPGDEVKVSCVMKTAERVVPTFGGLATTDEMCLAFLNYYPKTNLGKCENYPAYLFEANSTIYNYLGLKPKYYENSTYTNFGELMYGVNWAESTREQAQRGVNESAYYTSCLKNTGDYYPSTSTRVPVVKESSLAAPVANVSILLLVTASVLKALI